MGFYRPLVERAQGEQKPSGVTPSERILTIPTAFGSLRVPLAVKAAQHILNGEKGATPYVAAMWATDMEGVVARKVDKLLPKSGLGSSNFGARADVAYDALSVLILGSALLAGPNITKSAKLATAAALGKEGVKTAWWLTMNKEYKSSLQRNKLPVHELSVAVKIDGKESVVEEAIGLTFATATNDVESPVLRTTFGGLALAHCIPSAIRGEKLRLNYHEEVVSRLGNLSLSADEQVLKFD